MTHDHVLYVAPSDSVMLVCMANLPCWVSDFPSFGVDAAVNLGLPPGAHRVVPFYCDGLKLRLVS